MRAAVYYISLEGHDGNSGTSPQNAWRSVERIHSAALHAGDRVLFQGGATFSGTLLLHDVKGESDKPVLIGSYGEGRATVHGGIGHGIQVTNSKHIRIRDINVRGNGRKSGSEQGVGVLLLYSEGVLVEHVDTQGFQRAGLEFIGCSNLRVMHVHAADNGYAGISSGFAQDRVSTDVYIGYCRAINNAGDPTITDNHSGNGIVLYNLHRAVIEYCEAANNGWDMQQVNENGPVGIWTACGADEVVIQYCISHHNRSPRGDGGGFDLDGGTTNTVIQYCYSYQNDGCGYLLCQYPGGAPWHNNTVRYCVSENDGNKDHRAGIFTYIGAGQFSGCDVYNNVVYNEGGRSCVHNAPPDSRFYNNIFILRGEGSHVTQLENGSFAGNVCWTIDGALASSGSQGMSYINPCLYAPGKGERVVDPRQLPYLNAYRLKPESPIVGAGVVEKPRFSPLVETLSDFYGNPAANSRTPGIHQ